MRPVPELEFCFVFTPDDPNVYTLNATAWLIFELCDGRGWAALERAFYEAVEPLRSRAEARDQLAAALQDLERKGIVVRAA